MDLTKRIVGDVAWGQLKQKTVESLRTLGINFTDEGILGINQKALIKMITLQNLCY
jgi:hypothetical protein